MSDRLNIIDTIEKDDKFSAFARMLRTSKAGELLAGPGPFTVFAPTKDAFGKVPDKEMNGWLSQTDQTQLARVLSHHILPGKLFASNLSGKQPTATLSGSEVTFTDTDGLKVSGSGILGRNIEATNGMIHAVDTVLLPPAAAMSASAAPAASTAPNAQADGHNDIPAAPTTSGTSEPS